MNFYFRQFLVSCDVITQKSRVRAIDDARVAGVTFSLCSCHDNSTVFREKLSVLTAELTRSSLCNLRETLQLIWSPGCNSASESRVRPLPWKFSAVFKTCCSLVHLSGCLFCHRCHRWKEKHVWRTFRWGKVAGERDSRDLLVGVKLSSPTLKNVLRKYRRGWAKLCCRFHVQVSSIVRGLRRIEAAFCKVWIWLSLTMGVVQLM